MRARRGLSNPAPVPAAAPGVRGRLANPRSILHTVESHTEGMPTRVVTGGVGTIPGATMAERRAYFIDHLDHIRTLLMCEPRGHAAMSGAILQNSWSSPPSNQAIPLSTLFQAAAISPGYSAVL